jgi:hypothetical protein
MYAGAVFFITGNHSLFKRRDLFRRDDRQHIDPVVTAIARYPAEFFSDENMLTGQSVIVATENEYAEILALLENAASDENLLGRISPGAACEAAICSFQELPALQERMAIREVIFCVGELSLAKIITAIPRIIRKDTRILFHLAGSGGIVGSDTQSPGKVIAPFTGYRIAQPHQVRMKRVTDLWLSSLILLSAPVHLLVHASGTGLLRNAAGVLAGRRTWVGYASGGDKLPGIKTGVIPHLAGYAIPTDALAAKADQLYAKNYDWWQDLVTVLQLSAIGEPCAIPERRYLEDNGLWSVDST